MKLLSWNVNGIRACIQKGCLESLKKIDADIIALQEVRAPHNELEKLFPLDGYAHWDHIDAEKKGYSGVLTASKKPFTVVAKGVGIEKFDSEGRILITDHKEFYLINAYFPNTKEDLSRIDFKVEFNKALFKKAQELRKNKPVIVTGDFNVAHKEIDLANPKANDGSAGFHPRERESFSWMLDLGYIDTFREFNQDPDWYSWWTYRFGARSRNVGWRIDYFLVSEELKKKLKNAEILNKVMGSDHCPVTLELK